MNCHWNNPSFATTGPWQWTQAAERWNFGEEFSVKGIATGCGLDIWVIFFFWTQWRPEKKMRRVWDRFSGDQRGSFCLWTRKFWVSWVNMGLSLKKEGWLHRYATKFRFFKARFKETVSASVARPNTFWRHRFWPASPTEKLGGFGPPPPPSHGFTAPHGVEPATHLHFRMEILTENRDKGWQGSPIVPVEDHSPSVSPIDFHHFPSWRMQKSSPQHREHYLHYLQDCRPPWFCYKLQLFR